MSLSPKVIDRLRNWKFEQAMHQLEFPSDPSEPEDWEQDTITALYRMYGNVGWFEGYAADIVRAAVWALGIVDD